MTTTLQKYPIPNPSSGVMRGVHPRELGFGGFSFAKNWVKRGGIFQTRDGLTQYPVTFEAPLDPANEIIMGLYQYDYQKDGIYEWGNDPSKDSIIAVTDAALYHAVPEAVEWWQAEETSDDFLTPVIGPNATTGKRWDYTDKIEIYLEDTNWVEIATALGVSASSLEWITVELWVTAPNPGECSWEARIYDGVAPPTGPNEWIGPSETGVAGVPVQLSDGPGDNFGIWVLFNDVNFDNEIAQFTGPSPPYILYYRCRIWQGAEQDESFVLDGDRDNFEVMRAWDFGQETHVLIASPTHPIADFTMGNNTVRTAGGGVTTPKAKAIALAGQRVVAGNVSFLDAVAVIEENEYHENDFFYVSYPDGIVYSGTVLEDGHNKWYQEYLIRIADTPGSIVAAMEMGTMMCAVYKTDAIYVLAVQSGTEPFRPDLRASGIQGPVSSMAVCAISDNLHVFLGRDGALYFFDGSAPRSMGPHIQDWLTADLDNDYANRSFLVYDNEARELKVWYPAKGQGGKVRCGITISFDDQAQPVWPFEYDTGTIISGDPPGPTHSKNWDMTCALDVYVNRSAIPGQMLSFSGTSHDALGNLVLREKALLICHALGSEDAYPEIFYEDPSAYDGTIPIKASFLTGATDFESLDRMKVVTEVELLCDQLGYRSGVAATDSLEITLWHGNQNTFLEQAEIQMVDLTASPPYFAEFRTEGRFFAIGAEITATRKTTFGGALAAYRILGRPR